MAGTERMTMNGSFDRLCYQPVHAFLKLVVTTNFRRHDGCIHSANLINIEHA